MWCLVSLVFILLSFVSLLFMPMVVYIDTDENIYYLKLKPLVTANLLIDKTELIIITLEVLFVRFNIYPLKQKTASVKIKKTKKKAIENIGSKKMLRLIKTFRVKEFYMDIDTGNCITNAKLYPLFALLNSKYGGFYVNFKDRNSLLLSIENRPIRIIKALFRN